MHPRPAPTLALALLFLLAARPPSHAESVWEIADNSGLVRLEFDTVHPQVERKLAEVAGRRTLTVARLVVENRRPDRWLDVDTHDLVQISLPGGRSAFNVEMAWPLFHAHHRTTQYLFESDRIRPTGERLWWVAFEGSVAVDEIEGVTVTIGGRRIGLMKEGVN
jgi:hypothetical protein